MHSLVAIRRNQHCWGSQNEDFAPPQQHPHGYGYSRHDGLATFSARIFGHVSFARVKGLGGWQETTGHRSPIFSPSAAFAFRSAIATAYSPGGVTAGGLSHAPTARRRPFNSVWPFEAARRLFLVGIHSAFAVRQNHPRWTANLLHFSVLSRLHFHAQQQSMEFDAWRTEKLSLRNHSQGVSV